MRSDTAPTGRVRLVITLSVISAVMIVAGGILVEAHLTGHHPGGHLSSLGVALGVAGLAVGVVTLLVFALTRSGRSARRRPASHRRRAVGEEGC